MWKLALLGFIVALVGCESTMRQEKLAPVQSGQRITLAKPVTIVETRGPLALKLEWQLLPGVYVERYSTKLGRMFQSDGPLVQFTPTIGEKTRSVGGFIMLKGQPGVGKLYVVSKGQTPAFLGVLDTLIVHALIVGPGDISMVTDFPLSRLRE
jgi:hypothetical protein